MFRDPFVSGLAPGRLHMSLRTLAANDNAPLPAVRVEAAARSADGGAGTCWSMLKKAVGFNLFAKLAVFPAPSRGLGVEAGKLGGARP